MALKPVTDEKEEIQVTSREADAKCRAAENRMDSQNTQAEVRLKRMGSEVREARNEERAAQEALISQGLQHEKLIREEPETARCFHNRLVREVIDGNLASLMEARHQLEATKDQSEQELNKMEVVVVQQ